MSRDKFIGEAQIQELPQKPFKLKLGPKVVKLENLADEVVIEKVIPDNSITTSKIVDGAVTTSKLASDVLSPLESRVGSLEYKVGNGTVDSRIQDAITPIVATVEANKHDADTKFATVNVNLNTEIARAEAAESSLSQSMSSLSTALNNKVDSEITRATATENQINADINTVNSKIPSAASSINQLADKAFVNSSIATNTANYISNGGEPFVSYAELLAYQGPKSNNDYAFVKTTDSSGNTIYKRYKYTANTGTWALEYELNNSSFTSAQWEAINSGITLALKNKLNALPTSAELTTMLGQKQDVISDLATIRSGASAGSTAYQKPSVGIPETDLSAETRARIAIGVAAYQKPSTGVPRQDLSVDVQTSLSKADTAIQNLSEYYTKSQTDTLLQTKQNILTIDSTPTKNSNNPISSDAVYDLEQFTTTSLANKQEKLTFDNLPTAGSANPVTSGGIYTAIVNSSGVNFITVEELPAPSAGTTGAVYVLEAGEGVYEWYITIYDQTVNPPEYKWKLVNSIDLTEYYTKTEVDTLLAEKQDELTFATSAECISEAEELT